MLLYFFQILFIAYLLNSYKLLFRKGNGSGGVTIRTQFVDHGNVSACRAQKEKYCHYYNATFVFKSFYVLGFALCYLFTFKQLMFTYSKRGDGDLLV